MKSLPDLIKNLLHDNLERRNSAKNQKSPEEEEQDGRAGAFSPLHVDNDDGQHLAGTQRFQMPFGARWRRPATDVTHESEGSDERAKQEDGESVEFVVLLHQEVENLQEAQPRQTQA